MRQFRDVLFRPKTTKARLVWVKSSVDGTLKAQSLEGSMCPRCKYTRHAGGLLCFLGKKEIPRVMPFLIMPHMRKKWQKGMVAGTEVMVGLEIAKAAAERAGREVADDEDDRAKAFRHLRQRAAVQDKKSSAAVQDEKNQETAVDAVVPPLLLRQEPTLPAPTLTQPVTLPTHHDSLEIAPAPTQAPHVASGLGSAVTTAASELEAEETAQPTRKRKSKPATRFDDEFG